MSNCRLTKKLWKLLNKRRLCQVLVRYKSLPINLIQAWISVKETLLVEDNLTRLSIGVTVSLQTRRPIFVYNSNAYFLWFVIIPFLLLVTSKLIKCLKSPRSLILNVLFKASLTQSISFLSFPAKIMSFTYTNNVVKDPSEELMNKEWSFIDWVYPAKIKRMTI